MPLIALKDLPDGALLAIDPGSKRIGIAACDAQRILVSPVETVTRSRFSADAEAIFRAYDARDCAGMVMGLPVNMDGREGPRAQSARAMARNLMKIRDIPIALNDERLTTSEATERLRSAGVRAARRGAVVDQMAAVVILEDALAKLAMRSGETGEEAG